MEVKDTPLALLRDEIPNDETLLDELLALVERVCPQAADGWQGYLDAPPAKKQMRKKIWGILSACLFYGVLLCLVGGAFLLSQGDKKPILGYSFMNVLTWSMQSEIPQGSLVVLKKVDPGAIRITDDITFMRDPETPVTHRVIGIVEDFEGTGERGFETQGVDNDTPDFEIVGAANVIGAVKFHIPKVGAWLEWLHGHLLITLGFTAGLVLLFILLMGAFGKKPSKGRKV
ncbi:MAG: signal peptidase I [Firmicutes bacterium]|nr:signal peptidase I [Bacillota bacterium]